MLNSLQGSVESAETEWKVRLSKKESELDELKKKNAALEQSMQVVDQAQEVN